MWVFTKDGFFTAVFKECQADEIMIRAKSRADLKSLLKKISDDGPIRETAESPYRFFVVLKKSAWIQYLSDYVEHLDYATVRDNIVSSSDTARQKAYQTVWTTMHNWMGRAALGQDDL
jgi:hypothetical protein